MSEMFEALAHQYIERLIERIDFDDVYGWYDCCIATDESYSDIKSIAGDIMDAIKRVNNIEFRKS